MGTDLMTVKQYIKSRMRIARYRRRGLKRLPVIECISFRDFLMSVNVPSNVIDEMEKA